MAQTLSKAKLTYFAALSGKKSRQQEGLFTTEGLKMLNEGLRAGWLPHAVVATAAGYAKCVDKIQSFPEDLLWLADEKAMSRLSTVVSPEGIVAVWAVPAAPLFYEGESAGMPPLPHSAFLLDEVRDPGNMGTLIRTAEWFGLSALIASPGCADCFNPKVLRSSMGSLFRMPVFYLNDFETFCRTHAEQISGAAMQGRVLRPGEPPRKWILLGNEARGLSPALRDIPGIDWITIPGAGVAESLNVAVAAGILAHAR